MVVRRLTRRRGLSAALRLGICFVLAIAGAVFPTLAAAAMKAANPITPAPDRFALADDDRETCEICAVPRVAAAPALDGDLSEWSGFAVAPLDRDRAATIHGTPPERADLMGTLQWGWDAPGLYLAVHVRDDVLVHDSSDLAEDDVFELAIDGDGDNAGGGPGDHLYRITHDGRQSDRGAAIHALTVAARTVPTGWNLEIFIPSGHLNLGALEPGCQIRLNWALGDDDNGGDSDGRLIAFGTRLDPPEAAWSTDTLDGGTRAFVGLVESGRWEWAGGGAFNDIFFVDDAYGWTVGPGVWRTTDGGKTWRHVSVLAGTSLARVIFADRRRGWAQGMDGRVVRTEDGGETWALAADTRSIMARPALATAGMDDVWAFRAYDYYDYDYYDWEREYEGSEGSVRTSTDGGVSWQEAMSGGDIYFEVQGEADLDLITPSRGWALWTQAYDSTGEGCQAFAATTTDGGASWAKSCVSTDLTRAPGIAFGSSDDGWVIGSQENQGLVWRSTDGGATWQEQATLPGSPGWIQAQDASRAWIGIGTSILRTTDGGETWQPLAGSGPTRALFGTESLGWGVGGGTIFKTTNGGASWQTVFALPSGYAPWYWNYLAGWRADGAAIQRTTDGGATWQAAGTGLPAIGAFRFVDTRNGWAWHGGSLGVAHTTDGGATWQAQSTGTNTLSDLQFVDSLTGWVRGDAGELRRTTDGGQSWQQVAPAYTIGYSGVQFVDRDHGWTSGSICQFWGLPPEDYGECSTWIAGTADGGLSWARSIGGAGVANFFLDTHIGWGFSTYDRYDRWWRVAWDYALVRHIDGARLWSTSGEYGYPGPNWRPCGGCSLVAVDSERVWAWAQGGLREGGPFPAGPVAASTDGGATWTDQRAEAAQLSGVRFDHAGLAYAYGNGTLRYRNTEVAAYRAYRPPQIDGNLADWAGVPAYGLKAADAFRVTGAIPVPLDASVVLQAAWDADNLYFAVRVYDQKIVVDSGARPWQDDAIEIGLDGRHDHVRTSALNDDRQFTVTSSGAIYESGAPLTGATVARTSTADGYILELAIPVARLGNFSLAAKTLAGLNWALIDDDDGGNADSKLEWTGAETYAANASWGQLRLSALEAGFGQAATQTPTPTATATARPTETSTATPTASQTPTPTSTAAPTATPTPTGTETPTSTPTIPATATDTPTSAPTATSTPSATATPTATASPRPRFYLPLVLR